MCAGARWQRQRWLFLLRARELPPGFGLPPEVFTQIVTLVRHALPGPRLSVP